MSLSRSAETPSDPFSDVLAALDVRSVRGSALRAAGRWALSFDGRQRLKFIAVIQGGCWVQLPGHPPMPLAAGDVLLINNTAYTVSSAPGVAPIDGMPLYATPGHDVVQVGGGGDEVVIIGGGCGFADGCGSFVLDALPPWLAVERDSPTAAAVKRTLESLRAEVDGAALGGALVAERLADILVVAAIRAFVAASPGASVGWITALADPRIGKALRLLHGDVARRWTVPMLASRVGMSRSAFTQRFSARVGRPPLDYLTHWRMVLAQQGLRDGRSVATVAAAVGYASQSAFSSAFKRRFGRSPRSGGG